MFLQPCGSLGTEDAITQLMTFAVQLKSAQTLAEMKDNLQAVTEKLTTISGIAAKKTFHITENVKVSISI